MSDKERANLNGIRKIMLACIGALTDWDSLSIADQTRYIALVDTLVAMGAGYASAETTVWFPEYGNSFVVDLEATDNMNEAMGCAKGYRAWVVDDDCAQNRCEHICKRHIDCSVCGANLCDLDKVK